MRVFDASIEQLLWPEKRELDAVLGDKVHGTIDRTTARSWIRIPPGYVPEALRPLQGTVNRFFPWVVGSDGGITIGPIPAGVPVNLLANLQPLAESADPKERITHAAKLIALLARLKDDLSKLPADASDADARRIFANLAKPLMELSKCPDYVVNRGHYFGTGYDGEPGLSDDDKRALIAFVKTF
jgi:hypothetical protein